MLNVEEKIGLHDKTILIVGFGRTGISVANFLQRNDLPFDVADSQLTEDAISSYSQTYLNAKFIDNFNAEVFASYDALICSPGVPLALPAVQAAIESGSDILGDVELFARICTVPIIAVTGSNGKSTVVAWVGEVLQRAGKKAVVCGNIGEPVLDVMRDGAEVYVLELSSFQLETTNSLNALSATVLNVSEDHLDRYDSFAHYAETKRHIYKNAQTLVANAADQETWPSLQQKSNAVFVSYFGTLPEPESGPESGPEAALDITLEFRPEFRPEFRVETKTVGGLSTPWLCAGDRDVLKSGDLSLPGQHNVDNALAVLALIAPLNLDLESVALGLADFHGLRHRTQLVTVVDGVRWYNDSKGTNVDACAKAVLAMNSPVVLIAGGLGKDADFSALRAVVDHAVKALVLIGRDAAKIETAVGDLAQVHHADSMASAVKKAAGLAEEGDAILLSPACASFDMFNSFEHRGDVFIDEVMELAA